MSGGAAPQLRAATTAARRAACALRALASAGSGIALAACLAAPVLRSGGARAPWDEIESLYPPGTESVELPLAEGGALRGVWSPADPGAPVVLALIEDRSSVAELPRGYAELAVRLGDLGFALLACDWRGVGVSPGSRSARHIGPDARLLLAEAVRRAGGDPARVAVRGVALGTLGVAELLAAGEPFGGAILTAPVRPGSFPHRQASEIYGPVPGGIAWLCFRRVPTADPVEALASSRAPAIVLMLEGEGSLDGEDHAALIAACARPEASARELPLVPGAAFLGQRAALAEELEWLARRFPARIDAGWRLERARAGLSPAASARLADDAATAQRFQALARLTIHTPPEWVAAASAAGYAPAELEILRRARARPGAWSRLAFEDLVTALDLADPAGRLPAELVAGWMRALPGAGATEPAAVVGALAAIRDAAAARGQPDPEQDEGPGRELRVWMTEPGRWVAFRGDFAGLWAALGAGLSAPETERRFVRTLLKCWGLCAERLDLASDGTQVVRVLLEGQWIAFSEAAERDALTAAAPEAPKPTGTPSGASPGASSGPSSGS